MKRIAFLAVMMAWAISASATSVLYFTRSQADRAVSYLNRQSELMIYCGYEYEIETYVLLNEVWAEKVNSAYYELWIYGWDAYTGEEIYMPIDLQCIWLYSAGRMYNAAQYLRFRTSGTLHTPAITWTVPAYNHYTRVTHRPGYVRTYHYDVHRHGWMPPAPPAHHHSGPAAHPIHPYYMRAPHTPAPKPQGTWTPGVDRPQMETPIPSRSSSGVRPTPTQSGTATSPSTGANPSRSETPATPTRSGKEQGSSTTTTPTRSGSTTTTTTPSRSGSTTTTTPSRSGSTTTTTPSRSGSTTTTTPSRSGSSTTTTPSRSNSSATSTPSRNNSSSATSTPSRSGNSATTPSRNEKKNDSKGTTPTAPTRSGSGNSGAAPTRR